MSIKWDKDKSSWFTVDEGTAAPPMTFAALYAACAGRLQGRTWSLEIRAGSFIDGCDWVIYVANLPPHFARGGTPEHALAQLDAMLALEGKPTTSLPEDIGICEVKP